MAGSHPIAFLQPFTDELQVLADTEGMEMMMLVKSVILTKMLVENVSSVLETLDVPERDVVGPMLVETVSEIVATMCTLAKKDFKADVMPRVHHVMSKSMAKQSIQ
jgi:hypothetical protein